MLSAKEAFDKTVKSKQKQKELLDKYTNKIMTAVNQEVSKRIEEGKLTAIVTITMHKECNETVLKNVKSSLTELGYDVTHFPIEYVRIPINHHSAYELKIDWSNAYSDVVNKEEEKR